jgi:hypothetical protein
MVVCEKICISASMNLHPSALDIAVALLIRRQVFNAELSKLMHRVDFIVREESSYSCSLVR